MIKRNIILSYILGCIALISAGLVQLELSTFGFWDGYRTTLERAEENLFPVFIWGSVIMGIVFFCLPWVCRKKNRNKILYLAVFLYVLFVGIIGTIEYYYVYVLRLENGTGG